ncbi:uncharacterized protein EI97DRAFT_428894 [Westerdykella ornata]|uniref:Uncharacterized protein n=1 Tax=Westerdykella ornata TaxID=318751 RepID=A0A6A6K0B4_WESOR|nr:uncharacterized protein EI97DRAFT_428894 [Westerdykella ornata]KAF2280789.1 hypothetical protein EI97DRAFT_428894 [Westerdykella ornata]
MASSRAYIPSASILRALSRPRPIPCPFSQRLSLQTVRGAARRKKPKKPQDIIPKDENIYADQLGKTISAIEFYEQDLDEGTAPKLVKRISTREQAMDEEKKWRMALEDATNPDYDDTELRKQILDDMLADPTYDEIKDYMIYLRAKLEGRENETAYGQELQKITKTEDEIEAEQMWSRVAVALHESAQKYIDNPEYASARKELEDFQAKLVNLEKGNVGFEESIERLNAKLQQIPAAQKQLEEVKKELPPEWLSDEWLDKLSESEEAEEDLDEADPIDQFKIDMLLMQMQEIMAAMGNKEMVKEIQTVLDDKPSLDPEDNADEFEEKQGFDVNELKARVASLKQSTPDMKPDPKADAVVESMLADPYILDKLAAIKHHIVKQKAYEPPSAPDPETLDKSRLTTYKQRLRMVENDPEHLEALEQLRVDLPPPFNAHPALKSLNQALKLAYLGASDDVRRILWRSYMRAREVPTLLQNIPDDAWDILWYSQAVNWASNQNRDAHLKLLMADLRTVDKEGPPTPPDALPV